MNGQNHEIADLRDDLSRLIGKLQEQSPALQQWVITSVQMVNYQDGKTPKSCYFLSGYPLDETLPMILNDSPIQ